MTIMLTPEQQAWIEDHAARGAYASTEDAVRALLDDAMAVDGDDLAWAKPLVDEALMASARGDVLSLEEHRARNQARPAAMRT